MPLSFQYLSNVHTREENRQIKDGGSPEAWGDNKRREKDVEARWTKKHGKIHYGRKNQKPKTKNHISIDREYKVIRKYAVTSAEVHDSQVFEELLDENNSNGSVWADSAYRSEERESALAGVNYRSHHRKSTWKRPLNEREQEANRKRLRVRVEHVFAQQANRLVRSIGQVRAAVKIGMMNLEYNMRQLVWLAG
ncbi:transposase [Candidatus Vondammii sp. HM_W22]|uniref:transposase n=1 Tax=Candidatus Vondammii sp. HM_W22 TaxID=2687299 RepID=UPI001F13D60D|nr:transposase [Candidatus Vondammii sp. HM_W22]